MLACFEPGCPEEVIDEGALCVADCTQEATAEIAPPGLSDGCIGCTEQLTACGAVSCADVCARSTGSAACNTCLCENDCYGAYYRCSGLPNVRCPGPDGRFPCTEDGIRDALTFGGGPHTFACDGPTTVVTSRVFFVANNVILDG